MSDPAQLVNALRRPRLLLRAVRHGLGEYQRDRVLRRVLGGTALPAPRRAVMALLAAEELLETARQSRDAGYSVARHVEVLIALVCEARTLSSEAARAERDARQDPPLRRASA